MSTFGCGHPQTPENTYSYNERHQHDGPRGPRKICRTCAMERARNRYKPREQTLKKFVEPIVTGTSIKEKPCLLAETWK